MPLELIGAFNFTIFRLYVMSSLFKQHFLAFMKSACAPCLVTEIIWFVVIVIYAAELPFYDTSTAFFTEALCNIILSDETISHFHSTISKMAKLFLKWRQKQYTRVVPEKREHFRYLVKYVIKHFCFCQLLMNDILVILTKNLKVLVPNKYENGI